MLRGDVQSLRVVSLRTIRHHDLRFDPANQTAVRLRL